MVSIMPRPASSLTFARREAKAAGLSRFFTGDPCKNGHVAERITLNYWCVECQRISMKTNYDANPTPSRNRSKEWNRKNKDKVAQKNKIYREKHKERLREINAARARKWFKENKERAIQTRHARRALQRNAPGSHTAEQLRELLIRQRYKCAFCLTDIKKKRHLDHIHALTAGGSNDISNLQWLCPTCNLRKHDKDPIVWARENGRLF